MREADIFYKGIFAGRIRETEAGTYMFQYDQAYLARKSPQAVSLTLPLQAEAYESTTMFPFFDGLIPEGCPHT